MNSANDSSQWPASRGHLRYFAAKSRVIIFFTFPPKPQIKKECRPTRRSLVSAVRVSAARLEPGHGLPANCTFGDRLQFGCTRRGRAVLGLPLFSHFSPTQECKSGIADFGNFPSTPGGSNRTQKFRQDAGVLALPSLRPAAARGGPCAL